MDWTSKCEICSQKIQTNEILSSFISASVVRLVCIGNDRTKLNLAQTKKAEILCYLKHRTTSNKIQNQLKLQTDTLTTEMSTLIGIFTNQTTFTS